MSNPFAIAAVTATFSQLLGRVTQEPTLSGATVTTRPPDVARPPSSTGRQINLFLYQVTPNGAWRNADLPFRNDNGELVNRPALALNLQYLLTAYGQNDDDVDAHHLLAHAMSLVHDEAVLTREQVRRAQIAQPEIAPSDLADQVELVKLCPQALTPDDLFKLWSAFQTNYRVSVAYEASVILIERPQPARVALPVRVANVYVRPFRTPVIESVSPQVLPIGGTLTIEGQNLRGDIVRVRVGTQMVDPTTISDRRIELTLPAGLLAGINTVQVVHELELGSPPTPHRGFESNVAAFILAPLIATPPPITVAPGATLTLEISPPVGRAQRATLLVGDQAITIEARSATGPATTPTLGFPIPADSPTGTFLLRVQIDGAESPLEVDEDPASPTFDQYVGPLVTITP